MKLDIEDSSKRRDICVNALVKSLRHLTIDRQMFIITSWLPVEELEDITKKITESGKR